MQRTRTQLVFYHQGPVRAADAERSALPLTRMIIVIADDQTVAVLPDIASVRRECEAVDVEDGVYRFFDELGRRLVPRFIAPVERRLILLGAITSIGGGSFELELDPQDEGSAFETSLANVVVIEPNGRFTTIPDLARHVAERRRLQSEL